MFYVQTFILLVVVVIGLVCGSVFAERSDVYGTRSRTPKTTERQRHRNGNVILGSKESNHPEVGCFCGSFLSLGVSIDFSWTQQKLESAAPKTTKLVITKFSARRLVKSMETPRVKKLPQRQPTSGLATFF